MKTNLKSILQTWIITSLLFTIVITSHATETTQQDTALEFSKFDLRYTDDLEALKQRKVIRALIVPSRTDFYLNKGKIDGLMVRYLDNYEKKLNKDIKKEADKIRIIYVPVNFDALIPALLEGRGDIAASFLTLTDEREQKVSLISGKKMKVNELVVSHKETELSTLEDLAGKEVYVLKNSSYITHLKRLNKQFKVQGLAAINIVEAQQYLSSEDLLEMLDAGVIDITIVDDFKALLWEKVLTNIKVRKDLIINEQGSVGWAVRSNNPELKQSLESFLPTVRKGSYLGNVLFQQFYGRDQKLSNLKKKKDREKYTQLIDMFKKYGQQYNINYLKLIAQSYQESGLNQNKKSHRGAVGIMQLLPSTAADRNVNIAQIDQLENNIHAGAKYMDFLRTRYFSDPAINPEDQVFFSWAAYNAGPANVRKMRNLAEKMGLDKNSWFKNVEVAAGQLIGKETVQYVSNIYKHYSTYSLMEKKALTEESKQALEPDSLWERIQAYLNNSLHLDE